jgi:hypothetical protein
MRRSSGGYDLSGRMRRSTTWRSASPDAATGSLLRLHRRMAPSSRDASDDSLERTLGVLRTVSRPMRTLIVELRAGAISIVLAISRYRRGREVRASVTPTVSNGRPLRNTNIVPRLRRTQEDCLSMKRYASALSLVLFLATTASALPPDRDRGRDRDHIFKRFVRVVKFIVQPLTDPIIPPRP